MSSSKPGRSWAVVLLVAHSACTETRSVSLGSIAPIRDLDFIDDMVPHFETVMMMADVEIARGAREEVRALAEQVKDTQMEQLAAMIAIRTELTGSDQLPKLTDPHTTADLAAMDSAREQDVDRLFLEHVITHEAAALERARDAALDLERGDLRSMAAEIVEERTAELSAIDAMRASF